MNFGKFKPYAIMAGTVGIGYMFFLPYLSGALGSVAGQYTTVVSVSLLAAGALWVQRKFGKKLG